jgi:uncharacterized protein YjbI with pentapeptide repeats
MDSRSKLARPLARVFLGAILMVLTMSVGLNAAASGSAGAATKLRKPGPPTAITFVLEGDAILASWSPPVSDGGSPITGYVESWVAGPFFGAGHCSFQAGPMTCGIGITRRGSHPITFHVRAVNSVGQGKAAKAKTYTSNQTDCSYLGPYANLENCNLAGVDLAGLNLSDSEMGNVDLSGADLSGANLLSAQIDLANLTNADLIDANVSGNLAASNLTDANLTGATVAALLGGANLTNANFTNANLTGVESGEIIGTPSALPSGFVLDDGYLIGPGAYLSHANFNGVDLTGVNLTNANLQYATTNTQTNFTAVVWSNTTCPDGTNSDNDGGTCVNNLG